MPGPFVRLRVRWPPFDPETIEASEIEVGEVWHDLDGAAAPVDICIGDADGYHIHREVRPEVAGEVEPWHPSVYEVPKRIRRARSGWFIAPSAIHRTARRLIEWAVVGIILSIAVHAFEPALVSLGILSGSIAGSVRIGMLDYPTLLLLFFPFFCIPIVVRVAANVWDFRRTRTFLSNQPDMVAVESLRTAAGKPFELTISLPEAGADWAAVSARINVGLLHPRRPALLAAYGREEGRQNPPGISTPLLLGNSPQSELGVGVGEGTPLEGPDAERLFLSPLPVQISGAPSELDLSPDAQTVEFTLPEGDWPGTRYAPLLAVHWELEIRVERAGKEGPLTWIEPLNVAHTNGSCTIPQMPVQSGRAELMTF